MSSPIRYNVAFGDAAERHKPALIYAMPLCEHTAEVPLPPPSPEVKTLAQYRSLWRWGAYSLVLDGIDNDRGLWEEATRKVSSHWYIP
jgi:hypothetical protein